MSQLSMGMDAPTISLEACSYGCHPVCQSKGTTGGYEKNDGKRNRENEQRTDKKNMKQAERKEKKK